MRKIFTTLLFFIPFHLLLLGQTKVGLESLIPPAPNAAELGKYGTIPVGTLTGVPNISFPLYEISSGSLRLPITLSYHAGGIQLNQKSTDVGLGWSVMAGGTISRTVFSAADNTEYGYFNYTPPSFEALSNITNYYTMAKYNIVGNTGYDLEPDLFVYNMGERSGKFIYNQSKGFVTIPFDPIKVQTIGSGLGITFQITDDNGTIYKFGQYSQTVSDFSVHRSTISSWYLTHIISSNFIDTISFSYETKYIVDRMEQHISSAGRIYGTTAFTTGTQIFSSELTYNELLVKEIRFKNGYVQFNRNTIRKDVSNIAPSGSNSLDEIVIYNLASKAIKKIIFDHSYFVSSSQDNWLRYRLKLTGFSESDMTGNTKKQHFFDYNTNTFPPYNSYDMDYWGFCNGKSNGNSLIPAIKVYTSDLNSVSFLGNECNNNFTDFTYSAIIGGADREPSASYMQTGMLNKITYPTGGYSVLEYEPHQYQSDEYIQQNRSGGGSSNGINKFTKNTTVFNFSYPSDPLFASVNFNGVANLSISFSASNMGNTEMGETQVLTFTDITTGISKTWKHQGDLMIPFSTEEKIILIPNHNYSLKQEIYGNNTVSINSFINWTENTNQTPIKIGGGLRIKSLKNYTVDNILSLETNYKYGTSENGLGIKLFDERYFYRNYEDEASSIYKYGFSGTCIRDAFYWQRNFMGITKYNSLNYFGSSILYSTVTKYEGTLALNIGKTVSNYNIIFDQTNIPREFINSGNYGSINNAWDQGRLIDETKYSNDGSKYNPVSKLQYEYGTYNLQTNYAILFKQYKKFIKESDCYTDPRGPDPDGYYRMGDGFFIAYRYPINTGAVRKVKETSTLYSKDDISKSISTITTYQYQNAGNRYVTETSITASDGAGNNNTKVTRLKYPQDVSGTVQTAMINKNILTPVLEEKTYKSLSGSETLLSTIQTNYIQSGNLLVKNNIQASIGSNQLESRIYFNQYNLNGNILEQQKTNDIKESYIWGHNSQYLIASATNSAVKDIFHTSFEEGDGNSADGDAITGKKSKTGGYTKSLTNLTAGTYILSYWQKSGSTWTYVESKIPVTGTTYNISVPTIQLDELRFYPVTAQMTTYTYEPLIGMTSQCDVNNKIIYYEYDSFGRLKTIRDQDKNVIKTMDYQYQKPNNQ